MNIVIIEDETLAVKKLESLIKKYDESISIVGRLASVKEAVKWLSQHDAPHLIFMDIHLEDGLSFGIFDQVQVPAPVIFTTAFDEYMINAFKVNSIDYLLKPINLDDLKASMDKYHALKKQFSAGDDLNTLLKSLIPNEEKFKKRFLINEGANLIVVDIQDVAYFFAEDKFAFVVTKRGKQHLIDTPLDRLNPQLDPKRFYRINRQFIVSADAIATMSKYGTNKLKLNLNPAASKEVFVSMDKYSDFKDWLNQ